ncbi:MAG: two-component regulator propeller domain-containing protein [Cyclobacteriaceae bacterium]
MGYRIVVLGVLWIFATTAFGQISQSWEKTIRFDQLDPAIQDSLQQRKVNCMLRDRRGTTWFGTQKGLVYYNGQEVVAVTDSISEQVILSQVAVQTLIETSSGDIWIGTKNQGAVRFRPDTKSYQQYEMLIDAQSHRRITSVLNFFEGETHTLWAGTFGGGVFYFDSLQDKFAEFKDPTDSLHMLSTSVVMDMHEDKHGILWGATFGTGLIRIDPHYQTVRQYAVTLEDASLPTNDLFCLEEGEEGTLWIGTYGSGLLQYDRRTEKFSAPFPSLANYYIQSMHYDRGYLWIATQEHGVFCYDTKRSELFSFSQTSADPYSIASNNVSQISVDAFGTLWAVTSGGISLAHVETILFSFLGNGSNSIINQPITAMGTAPSGDIWMGTSDASLYQWVSKDKKLVQRSIDFAQQGSISYTAKIITTISHDSEQGVWIGTSDGTVARWDDVQQQWKVYDLPPSLTSSLTNSIESIYQGADGTLWIGVLEQGLFYWDREKDRIQPASERWPSIGLSFTPKVFLEDEHYLWIGTLNKGIIQWHRATGQVVRYSKQADQGQSTLPSNQITGLAFDKQKYLWIGTFDQGLCRLNTRTGTFNQVTEQEGLLSNRVTTISNGEGKKIWVGTVQGVSSYNWQDGSIRNYPSEEFLNGRELVHYSAASYRNTQLFGTLNGVVLIESDVQDTQYKVPPILTTGISSYHHYMQIKPSGNPENQLDLVYNDNAIEVSYALQDLVFPQNHQYEYRLLGLEQKWKSVGGRTLAAYTNLAPGTYKFQVRARSPQNHWVEVENPFIVIIHPAWYQTLLFRLIMLTLILGLIVGVYYYRITRVQKHNHILEILVTKRTQELTAKNHYIERQHQDIQLQNQKLEEAQFIIQQKNDDLQSMNDALEERVQQRTQELATTNEALLKTNEELDLFVYRAYHDIIGPIARIEGLCQVAKMEATDQPVMMQYLNKLLTNCQSTRVTLQKVLQIHHVRHQELQMSLVNLHDFIQKIYSDLLIGQPSAKTYPDFSIQCDPVLCLETDVELITLILQSFLKNALQYSHWASDSWIRVVVTHVNSQGIKILVEDNGEGIVTSVREKVFTMFFRGHETKSGTGLGLYIAQLASERLDAVVTYSEEEEFTQFAVVFENCQGIVASQDNVSGVLSK